MTAIELKPCPFCGWRGVINLNDNAPYVYCESCDVRQTPFDSLDEAITAWNTRAHDAEVERLRAALNYIAAMHDGNPPLSLEEMPDIDYARRTIWSMRREAHDALERN